MKRWHDLGVSVLGLAAVGCIFLLLGTFLPYVGYADGEDWAVFDVDHLDTTWPSGLSYLIAVGTIPVAAFLWRRNPRVLGAFLVGLGLIVFLDFLGAFVIGPTTYETSTDLGVGGVLGTIGGALLLAAGVVSLATSTDTMLAPSTTHAGRVPPTGPSVLPRVLRRRRRERDPRNRRRPVR